MRKKLLSILALLCLTVTSAWAQWTGGTYTATANETINSTINVTADATLTINAGVTVTVNRSITVANDKTLTIVGPGTLTVYGLDGADGTNGSDGTNSVAAITGNITVKGATVNAIGGAAGNGGDSSTGNGGNGAVGARGLSNGTVTIYYGTINATGGKGGNGGNSTAGQGGNGGQGGYAKAEQNSENLYYYGGTVNFTSGAVGKGGTGTSGNGTTPGRRKAFAHNILTLENTQVTLTGDGANITPATKPTVNNYYTVNIVPNVVASGNCGTTGHESDVTWTLTSDDVMTISGTGAMADYATSNAQPWKNNRTSITSIVVGENVTHIGNNTFTSCTNATSVLLPTTLTSIGRNAFLGCNNASLTSISIPASVTSIGNYAFKDCSNLATVNIGSGVTSIGSQAFAGCTSLGTVTIPNSVTSIDYDAFKGCSSLATVTLNSNPFIGEDAFPAGATVTMNLTANAAGGAYWLTFYNENHNFEADANTQIFKAALTGTKLELTELTTDQTVTKDKPVILKSTASTITMTLTSTASGNDFDGNSLEGVWDPEGQPGTAGNIFVLNNGAQGVGFYRLATGKTLGVGKAYLTYDGALAPEFLGFGNETTAISTIEKMRNVENETFYDLQGRRVAQPTKGLYIVNGKKVMIK